MSVFTNNRPLLDAFRRGERAALAQVYFHFVDDVAALVWHGFGITAKGLHIPGERDPDRQADVIQEVFARAFSASARQAYDGVRPYRPYLLRIAKNLLVDRLRGGAAAMQQRGAPIDIERVIDENAPLGSGQRDDELYDQELSARAREYVATLAEEMRTLVTLRFELDLSQVDVAERMGKTRRRVRTLEGRVLRGLRTFLRQRGIVPETKSRPDSANAT